MRRYLWFAIPILFVCLLPLLFEAAWVGDFDVRLTIDADPMILEQPLRCITVHESQLSWAIDAPWTYEDQSGVRRIAPNQLLVSVTCMGRRGLFSDTYHYPQYLVVEYSPPNMSAPSPVRRSFPIPAGRGDRAMRILLLSESIPPE